MRRMGVMFLMFFVVVSSLSLSLQLVYKNYFCTDTMEYLEIAGRKITVCGKTCDFDYSDAGKANPEANFSYNFAAPPLFFEFHELDISVPTNLVSVKMIRYENGYHYQFASSVWEPPCLS